MSKSVLGGDLKARNEAKRLMNLLEEERAVLLTENNFREDYTDIKYSCSQCSDTGLTEDGQRCSCVKQRIGEAEIWQNLSSEKDKGRKFEKEPKQPKETEKEEKPEKEEKVKN